MVARAPVAQLDRAPGFEPVGRGFKSLRARQSSHRSPPPIRRPVCEAWGYAPVAQLDRASASGADPAKSEIPENPVFVEIIEGQKRSQEVRKRLAGPETAGSTAGRDWVAAGHAARVRSVRQDRAHRATAWIPAARTAPSTDRLTPCPDAFPATCGGNTPTGNYLPVAVRPRWVRAVHPRTRRENCRPILLAGPGDRGRRVRRPLPVSRRPP